MLYSCTGSIWVSDLLLGNTNLLSCFSQLGQKVGKCSFFLFCLEKGRYSLKAKLKSFVYYSSSATNAFVFSLIHLLQNKSGFCCIILLQHFITKCSLPKSEIHPLFFILSRQLLIPPGCSLYREYTLTSLSRWNMPPRPD